MKEDVQEILAGNLNYDELGVPVALLIEIIVLEDREHPRISPDSSTRPAMPELFVQADGENRTTDLAISPVMFRANPIGFAIAILLIPLLIGIMLLLFWWLDSRTTRLEINRHSVRYETGIFSKYRRGLGRRTIRTVRVQQSLLNRMLNVGSLEIYTASDRPEIIARDMFDPNELRRILGA